MKFLKLVIPLLIFFLDTKAQVQDSLGAKWSVNLQLAHYDREKDNELSLGDIGYNVNPGLEIIYQYPLNNSCYLNTGVSYQYLKLISHIETADRFKVGELSIPLLFSLRNKIGFSITSGVYAGQFLHFSWEKHSHHLWIPVNTLEREHYADKSFFMDAYLGFEYKWKGTNGILKVIPFTRYRFKENWMNYYRTSIYYGIKLGIDLNVKTK
jgi:hypothetical protein